MRVHLFIPGLITILLGQEEYFPSSVPLEIVNSHTNTIELGDRYNNWVLDEQDGVLIPQYGVFFQDHRGTPPNYDPGNFIGTIRIQNFETEAEIFSQIASFKLMESNNLNYFLLEDTIPGRGLYEGPYGPMMKELFNISGQMLDKFKSGDYGEEMPGEFLGLFSKTHSYIKWNLEALKIQFVDFTDHSIRWELRPTDIFPNETSSEEDLMYQIGNLMNTFIMPEEQLILFKSPSNVLVAYDITAKSRAWTLSNVGEISAVDPANNLLLIRSKDENYYRIVDLNGSIITFVKNTFRPVTGNMFSRVNDSTFVVAGVLYTKTNNGLAPSNTFRNWMNSKLFPYNHSRNGRYIIGLYKGNTAPPTDQNAGIVDTSGTPINLVPLSGVQSSGSVLLKRLDVSNDGQKIYLYYENQRDEGNKLFFSIIDLTGVE